MQRYIPWCSGADEKLAYSSGQESYWLLSSNPFLRKDLDKNYLPETLFGIWNHSYDYTKTGNNFDYTWSAQDAGFKHVINSTHLTYEAIVVQNADDITWAIENLNDATCAALLNKKQSLYNELQRTLDDKSFKVSDYVARSLRKNDSGGLYTYFILDFIKNSKSILDELKDGKKDRIALKEGARESFIGLSEEADLLLQIIKTLLCNKAFKERRVDNRRQILRTITYNCLDIFYEQKEILKNFIENRAKLEDWGEENEELAQSLVDDEINRIQLCVDVMAYMGDQEIFDIVGMHSF